MRHVRHGTLFDCSLRSLRIALWSPPISSSLGDERRVPSLLLSTAARDSGSNGGPAIERRASSPGPGSLPRLSCMSGLLRPVGPETASTYWVRRVLVFGATMVLAVAVALIVNGTSSGSAIRTNPSPSTAGYTVPSSAPPSWMQTAMPTAAPTESSASATSTPTPQATTRKASTKKTDRSGSPDCSGEDLRPTLTGKQRLALTKPNTFQLSLINGSDQTCMARVTRKNFTLTIDSGSDRIWSTADCPSVIKPISRKLGAEHAVAWSLTWDGKRSKPDCKSARKAPRPGTYVATAKLAGAEPVQLRMILEG